VKKFGNKVIGSTYLTVGLDMNTNCMLLAGSFLMKASGVGQHALSDSPVTDLYCYALAGNGELACVLVPQWQDWTNICQIMYGCHFVVCWIYFVFLGLVFFNTSD
jgi:hypothetical protein